MRQLLVGISVLLALAGGGSAERSLAQTASFDPALFKELTKGENCGTAVATPALMTYDPVNDRKGGIVLAINKVPLDPGSSGVQVQIQVDQLLEGYRPGRIVRIYPGNWPVIPLPLEESLGLMQ